MVSRLLCVLGFIAAVQADWTVSEVQREIKIRPDSLIETRTVYSVVPGQKKNLVPFTFFVPDSKTVGAIRVTADGEELKLGSSVSLASLSSGDEAKYEIEPQAVKATIEVTTLSGNVLRPYPAKAMELENQRVVIEVPGSVRCSDSCGNQSTSVALPENAGAVEQAVPAPLSGDSKSKSFKFAASAGKIRLNFFFNTALPVIKTVTKTIDVSHLGAAVSVSEQVELFNKAAVVEGEFNRIPYTHMRYSLNSPFRVDHTLMSVDATLPLAAENIHYRDVIGNVSTSFARRDKRLTRVTLRPRFPMLGGWKTEFDFMYVLPFDASDNPAQQMEDDETYLLSIPLLHSFANIFAEKQIVKLVLPPGVENVELSVPGRLVSGIKTEKMFGWLDTPLLGPDSGHTLLTFELGPVAASEKRTVSPSLMLKYTLPSAALYRGPLLLSLYVFVLFAIFIIGRRMQLSITDEKEAAADEAQNADHDVCQKLDDELRDLWVATSLVLEHAAANPGKREALDEAKKEFLERFTRNVETAEVVAKEFDSEDNRVRRTNRLMNMLKQVKEFAIAVLETAAAEKDTSGPAGRMVDLEIEIKALLDRVETGDHSASPPPTPQGTPPKPLSVRKRR